MSDQEESLNQIVSVTGCSLDQAKFFLESANGDAAMAVATYFENAGQQDSGSHAEIPTSNQPSSSATSAQLPQQPAIQQPQPQRGTYTLSGAPAEPLPAGWGSGSGSSRPASANRNPLRSNTGPRVTGFRDLASSSSAGGGQAGGSRFGGFGTGGPGSGSDDDESKDPANFYTGGAKSGLSVENPDDQRSLGAHGDAIKKILQQAKEGAEKRGMGGFGGAAPQSSGPRAFTGNAHTLGSDETPSSFIPDPSKHDDDNEDEDSDAELETATRSLIFWQDGFSVEDSDLLKYEENQELLQAIQSGRAPLALMKVQQDQRVDLQVQKRLNEKWTRQPGPPAGPWSGSGNRLGSVSPYPDSAPPSSSSSSMPGAFNSSTSASSSAASRPTALPVSTNVQFEVDSTLPTTRLQIRLRDGEKVVATFNHSHTVGDIRRYINASRPGEASTSYALQTTFPSKDLEDDSITLKDAGLLGSVVVQRSL
ncbi:hypothetical protein JCM5350_004793 [Sporobolomyces pararoseus]